MSFFKFSILIHKLHRVTSVHHRINSFEERSPEAPLTSDSQFPVLSPSPPSSPSIASSSSSFPSSTSSSSELRLVLLGRSGAGKSKAGNILLGQEEFKSCPESLTAITQECEKKKTLFEGRRVSYKDVFCLHGLIFLSHIPTKTP